MVYYAPQRQECQCTQPHSVIGNTPDFGSVFLGSSPGGAANPTLSSRRVFRCLFPAPFPCPISPAVRFPPAPLIAALRHGYCPGGTFVNLQRTRDATAGVRKPSFPHVHSRPCAGNKGSGPFRLRTAQRKREIPHRCAAENVLNTLARKPDKPGGQKG